MLSRPGRRTSLPGRQHDSKNHVMDNCISMGINHHRRNVAVAPPGLLIMITLLFWVAVTPLLLYLVFLGVLVVIARWMRS